MFEPKRAFSGFAVPDLAAAKAFYVDVLGLEVTDGEMGTMRLLLPGGNDVLVYRKPDHEPAGFTILDFEVDDIDAAVDALVERGAEMLRYDVMPQDERGIMREGGPLIAWFADPAGNVFAVLQER